jgi:hypothetical protein
MSNLREAYKKGLIKRSWDKCKKCDAVEDIGYLRTHENLCKSCFEGDKFVLKEAIKP